MPLCILKTKLCGNCGSNNLGVRENTTISIQLLTSEMYDDDGRMWLPSVLWPAVGSLYLHHLLRCTSLMGQNIGNTGSCHVQVVLGFELLFPDFMIVNFIWMHNRLQ